MVHLSKHLWQVLVYNDFISLDLFSHKPSSSLLSRASNLLSSLFDHLCLRLCRIRVWKECLHVSGDSMLTTSKSSLPRTLPVPGAIAVQKHGADKYLRKRNACCPRMRYRGVQKLKKFITKVGTLIDNGRSQLSKRRLRIRIKCGDV